jgi:hypothetical protein
MAIDLGSNESPEVIITFKGGKVIKETKGFKGGKCVEATKFIEELLKPTQSKVTFTAEYLDTTRKEDGLLA